MPDLTAARPTIAPSREQRERSLEGGAALAAPESSLTVDVEMSRRDGRVFRSSGEPVTFGVPFARGTLSEADASTITLRAAPVAPATPPAPTASRILDRWPDGSVRWLLVDGVVDVDSDVNHFQLVVGRSEEGGVGTTPPLRVQREAEAVVVDTGVAQFRVESGGPFPLVDVRGSDRGLLDHAQSGFTFEGEAGRLGVVRFDRITLVHSGAVRAEVRAEGSVRSAESQPIARIAVDFDFYAGSPTVRMRVTIHNPRRAQHPDGFWDLGDTGSILFKDLSLTLALPGNAAPARVRCSAEPARPVEELATPFELYQDSSGGEHWQSTNHLNREHKIPLLFRGYRLRSASGTRDGLRATPSVTVESGDHSLAATLPHFWENFPKTIEADDKRLVVRLFPAQSADLHELQGGEQKTHELFVAFGGDRVTATPLDWCRSRLIARCQPEWYCASGAVRYLTPLSAVEDRPRVELVSSAVEGDDTFIAKREIIDQYGWRHFGEIYGDHEAVRKDTPHTLVSHYNNQYDPIAGFAAQFMRSGDVRWWTQMDELAAHVADIDIYRTDEDKSAYNHGLFWHTYHYGDADTATHRTYPRSAAGKTHGGGPSGEHNYATGLGLHYLLTGNSASRTAAIQLGQYVVDADDGSLTVYRWFAAGATGYPTASGSFAYHGPGRGSGNSLQALLDAFHLSGERRYLTKAEQVVRRCIHPADDLPARQLLDVERKWFYTMFLQALGRYLDIKAELGERDAAYGYARASVLHYARWMAEQESPYLEHPERLEFPTETWAAQDIRKSDVFYHAARHATGPEREQFVAQGDRYYRYSTAALAGMPTRTFARPVIVLLTSGVLHAWCAHADRTLSAPLDGSTSYGAPAAFVPQRDSAKRNVVAAAALALAVGGAVVVWLVSRWLA